MAPSTSTMCVYIGILPAYYPNMKVIDSQYFSDVSIIAYVYAFDNFF